MPPETAAALGNAALATALARAGKRSATAAVAAAIIPLSMAVTAPPASAATTQPPPSVTGVTASVTSNGSGGFNYQYSFTSAEGQQEINQIELPEIQANEFLTNGTGGYLGSWPSGWSVSQQFTTAFPGDPATFKGRSGTPKPAAFIEMTYSGGSGFYGDGEGVTITLESNVGATIGSNAVVGNTGAEGGFSFPIDPPTPAPEPATLTILGSAIAGLVGFRRRKKI